MSLGRSPPVVLDIPSAPIWGGPAPARRPYPLGPDIKDLGEQVVERAVRCQGPGQALVRRPARAGSPGRCSRNRRAGSRRSSRPARSRTGSCQPHGAAPQARRRQSPGYQHDHRQFLYSAPSGGGVDAASQAAVSFCRIPTGALFRSSRGSAGRDRREDRPDRGRASVSAVAVAQGGLWQPFTAEQTPSPLRRYDTMRSLMIYIVKGRGYLPSRSTSSAESAEWKAASMISKPVMASAMVTGGGASPRRAWAVAM